MKRIFRLFVVTVITLFLSLNAVSAASKCSYEKQAELNEAAANIKVSYEEAIGIEDVSNAIPNDAGELPNGEYEYFKISIYNLTENFYVKITNDYNDEIKYLTHANTESMVATYDWKEIYNVVNFTITVYSSNETGCPNEEYRIMYLTTPRINVYATNARCVDNESFYLCQKYITETEEIDSKTFGLELEKYQNQKKEEVLKQEEENKSFGDKLYDYIKENKITIAIVSTIIVVGGVVTTVVVIKKRRSRLI